MGEYTELVMSAELVDPPDAMVEVLLHMIYPPAGEPDELPDHSLFRTGRWQHMLRTDSWGTAASSLRASRFESQAGRWRLNVRGNVKNYDREIQHFIDWIALYIGNIGVGRRFVGYMRSEFAVQPSLIYLADSPSACGDCGQAIRFYAVEPDEWPESDGYGPAVWNEPCGHLRAEWAVTPSRLLSGHPRDDV